MYEYHTNIQGVSHYDQVVEGIPYIYILICNIYEYIYVVWCVYVLYDICMCVNISKCIKFYHIIKLGSCIVITNNIHKLYYYENK